MIRFSILLLIPFFISCNGSVSCDSEEVRNKLIETLQRQVAKDMEQDPSCAYRMALDSFYSMKAEELGERDSSLMREYKFSPEDTTLQRKVAEAFIRLDKAKQQLHESISDSMFKLLKVDVKIENDRPEEIRKDIGHNSCDCGVDATVPGFWDKKHIRYIVVRKEDGTIETRILPD